MNFSSSVLGNYFLELELGNYQAEEVNHKSDTQLDLLWFAQVDNIDCNIVNLVANVGNDTNQVVLEDIFWILYFDVECTNNTVGYESLGLKRAIELNVKDMDFFGNSGENTFQQQLKETHPKWSLWSKRSWGILVMLSSSTLPRI